MVNSETSGRTVSIVPILTKLIDVIDFYFQLILVIYTFAASLKQILSISAFLLQVCQKSSLTSLRIFTTLDGSNLFIALINLRVVNN